LNVIAEALQYLAKLQTPKNPITVEVNGKNYAVRVDGTLGEYVRDPDPTIQKPTLCVSTLSAVVAAYKAQLDGLESSKVAVCVVDPRTVRIVDIVADDFGNRHQYVSARHDAETDFAFDNYYLPEDFIIKFRAGFYFNDEATKVQQLCSKLETGSTVSIADDGMSQTVVISTGTINKAPVTLPAEGVPLIPWRTFREATPVESKFLLRMKTAKDSLPRIALFEIDEKWIRDTMNSVRDYLREQLPEALIIA
jgi:hypothetical protein